MVEAVGLLLAVNGPGGLHFRVAEDLQRHVSPCLLQSFRGLAADGGGNGFIVFRLGDEQRNLLHLRQVGHPCLGIIQRRAQGHDRRDPLRELLRHLDGGHAPEGIAHQVDPLRIRRAFRGHFIDPGQHLGEDPASDAGIDVGHIIDGGGDHDAGALRLTRRLRPVHRRAVGQEVGGVTVAVENHHHREGLGGFRPVNPGADPVILRLPEGERIRGLRNGLSDVRHGKAQLRIRGAGNGEAADIEIFIGKPLRVKAPAVRLRNDLPDAAGKGMGGGGTPAGGFTLDGKAVGADALREPLAANDKAKRHLAPFRDLGLGRNVPAFRRAGEGGAGG